MKKEEILEMSRKENKSKDMVTNEVELKANTFASVGMLLLALIYFMIEIAKGNGINPAIYSMITLFNTILNGYMGIKIKEKRGLRITTSVIWGLLTAMLIFDYITR